METTERDISREAEAEKLNTALLREPDWRWKAFFPLSTHRTADEKPLTLHGVRSTSIR